MFTFPAVFISPIWSLETSADTYRVEIRHQDGDHLFAAAEATEL